MRMSGMDILARIYDLSPEEHGDKHALSSAQLRDIGTFEKGAECVVRQDSSIKRRGSSPNRSLPTDEVLKFIDHLILRK